MPPGSRAHLLLPTPLGLVHYDLADEAAFVGPGAKGNLHAAPFPFPTAKVAVRTDGSRFGVRALPGEPEPVVNGKPSTGTPLADGDRIQVGDQVALFRAAPGAAPVAPPPPRPVPAAAPAEAGAPRPRRAGPVVRPTPPKAMARTGLALSLAGGALMLLAVYQTVRYLQTPGAERIVRVDLPPRMVDADGSSGPKATDKATAAYDAARAFERDHGAELHEVVERYRAVGRDFPNAPAAAFANARVTELWPRVAEQRWKALEPSLSGWTNGRKYRSAIGALHEFEAKYGGTPSAARVGPALEDARTKARAALDAVRQRVAPLLASDPTRAYRALTTADLELPPDLEAELAALMARVREEWSPGAPGGEPGRAIGAGSPKDPGGNKRPPLIPPDEGGGAQKPGPAAAGGRDGLARAAWAQAKADLDAKRWGDARKGYAALLKTYADTATVTAGGEKIRAGRLAADIALRGPAALLREEATWKNERLEVEYQFDDDKSFLADFVVEQPFPDSEGTDAEVRSGMAILAGNTAIMLKPIFDSSDVTIEVDAVADDHRDYGLFMLQDSKDYRAVALDVGNTQFKLKKGAAAQVLSGHVLWLYGEGVWRDADPGERGFVRIAEKKGNSLKGGERVRLKLEVRGGHVDGEIHGKGDSADLKGALKGDDGRGVGSVRVGAFAFKGRVGIERLAVSGKVDAAWIAKEFERLLAAASGPD